MGPIASQTRVHQAPSRRRAWGCASNAWAVGGGDTPPGKTQILHWNGTAWKQVPSPTPKTGGVLFGVTATSATNAWAVGSDLGATIVQHWNGTVWK